MKKKLILKFIPLVICASFLVSGCQQAGKSSAVDPAMKSAAPAVKAEKNVYKGKILGKSNKAKTISIEVGKGDAAKTMMVKFDEQTTGLEHAVKDEAAIIAFKTVGNDKIATEIKPKLAELPQGVVEAEPDHVAALIVKEPAEGNYFLVDSRPAARFHEGSLPHAVSIPVPKITKEGALAVLPANKDAEIIFFCGGPT